jgi:hypothetical protein
MPQSVTCPACGLANDAVARVCRNCGLPIASVSDPLRGVMPGRVDLPMARRSGLSALIGLAMVVGLLVVGGTLALSGGGILTTGGRLGVEPAVTSAPDPGASTAAVEVEVEGGASPAPDGQISSGDAGEATTTAATSFEYTCDDGSIADLSSSKWQLSQFQAGLRDEEGQSFERITWEMSKRGSAKEGTVATMEWTTPKEARTTYGSTLVTGARAVVVTFDGPIDATVGQQADAVFLEPEGLGQIRSIDMFAGADGKVRTVIGIRGDSCARMSSLGWSKKGKVKNAKVYLDVERF